MFTPFSLVMLKIAINAHGVIHNGMCLTTKFLLDLSSPCGLGSSNTKWFIVAGNQLTDSQARSPARTLPLLFVGLSYIAMPVM